MYLKKPMKKIRFYLCSFGIIIGFIFPLYSTFFVDFKEDKKIYFIIGCIISGYLVGLFGYYIVGKILREIDKYYKKILFDKLGIEAIEHKRKEDLLLHMKGEFVELLDTFSKIMKREKSRLHELTIKDGLTCLYNHRHFYEYVEEKFANTSNSFTVLFCDIDRFKVINDTLGHMIGDCVLREVASSIKKATGNGEGVFRYGGEEFIVLLEKVTLDTAYEIAEKIRSEVKNSNGVQSFSTEKPITISIGVASYPHHGKSIEEVIDKADRAMYLAKKGGRDRCYIYDTKEDEIIGA